MKDVSRVMQLVFKDHKKVALSGKFGKEVEILQFPNLGVSRYFNQRILNS